MIQLPSPLKILMVCDLDNWILGEIARQISKLLGSGFLVKVLVSSSKDFYQIFKKIQNQYDLIHFLSPWDFFSVARMVQKPCVVNIWHVVDWSSFNPHFSRMDTVCVGSRQWYEQVKDHVPGDVPIKRMPYGLDTQVFHKVPGARHNFLRRMNLPEETVVLGFAGAASSNLNDRKGTDRLFQCLLVLSEKFDAPVKLRMIGRGWNPETIPPKLLPYVYLDDFIPSEELPDFYSSLDYYLCPSRIEGVPYPVLEAMSCETIVISTPVGVVPEIVSNGRNGYILEQERYAEGLLDVIEKNTFKKEHRQTCGELARRDVSEKFSWENALDIEAFYEIYKSALNRFYSRPAFERFLYNINALIFRMKCQNG